MMKKLISLVAIAAFMLAMAGCAVNANTGAITVSNATDKAANNVKVGTVTIGYVAPGEIKTVYFFKNEDAAKIVADGFELPTSVSLLFKGEVNLKTNLLYTLNLTQDSNDSSKYYYTISGIVKGGGTGESLLLK